MNRTIPLYDRERHPRTATNREQISQQAQDDAVHERRASFKRGRDDDMSDVLTRARQREHAAETGSVLGAGSLGKGIKKPKFPFSKLDGEDEAAASTKEGGGENTGLNKLAVAGIKKPRPKTKSGSIKKPRVNLEGIDPSARKAKRHRSEDSEEKPFARLNQATKQVGKRTGTKCGPSSAVTAEEYVEDASQPGKRKRGKTALSILPGESASASTVGPSRKMKPPRQHKPLAHSARVRAPKPAARTIGIPADLAHMDAILRDSASGALSELRVPPYRVAGPWARDPGRQENPPDSDSGSGSDSGLGSDSDSDSEDEYEYGGRDVPHARLKKSASAGGRAPGSRLVMRIPPRSVSATVRKPAVKRAPKPAPPSKPSRPGLVAQPVIWATVRPPRALVYSVD